VSLFKCESCGCVENTALCNFNIKDFSKDSDGRALCSECDPKIGKWHGVFPKRPATGLVLANDGFLYDPSFVTSESFKFREKHQGLKIVKIL